MIIQRVFNVLTVVNLGLLVFLLTQFRAVEAQGIAPVLRGRSLEIVDERGKVRASIKVQPADPNVQMPDGSKGYPETVILRLIDPNGSPHVKLSSSVRGAGLLLGGAADPIYVQLGAMGPEPMLKFSYKDGRQKVIRP